MKDRLKDFISSLKTNRKMQIGLCVLIVLLFVLGYFLFFHLPKTNDAKAEEKTQVALTEEEAYAQNLEARLEKLLSSIKDAGDVKVMVTLGSGFEYVYLSETTVKETSSGQVTTSQVVLVDGKPVIEQTIYPTIKGVLVSASGAKDVAVKLRLISALQTVIDVANEDITILTGN